MQNLIISSVTEPDYLQSVELRDDISDICSEIKKLETFRFSTHNCNGTRVK